MAAESAHNRLPHELRTWSESGQTLDVDGRDVFVRDRGTGEVPVVVIHGFPGSSYDWVDVVDRLPGRVIAFDLPGYGFSDKSPGGSYSLFSQADVVVSLLEQLGVTRCLLLAHDMGDTVTAELAHRANSGRLPFDIEQIVLTNGSVFIDLARLTRGQRLTLRLPGRALPVPMPNLVLRRSLAESFTPTAPAPPGAIETLVAAIQHNGGGRLLPKLIRYIEERRANQGRWTAGFVDFAGPLTLIWGEEDPIAVVAMAEQMQALRPSTRVIRLDQVGHWPSIEAPERLVAELTALL